MENNTDPIFFKNQELMFSNAFNLNHKFFVAKDNTFLDRKTNELKTVKQYTSLLDIDSFLNWELKLDNDHKNLYELLKDELIEIYDIDGDYTKPSFLNDDGTRRTYDEICTDFIDARLDFQEDYYKHIPLLRENFIIKRTDDPSNVGSPKEKISLHILIRNGMKFKNNVDLKKFTTKFKKYADLSYPKLIFDKSIYSKNRVIRILGHSKSGQIGRQSYRYKDFSTFNDICDRRLFLASYLIGNETYYDAIEEFDSFVIDDKIDPIEYGSESSSKENIEKLLNLIFESIDNNESTLCDTEISDKICYADWKNLVFTVLNCSVDESNKVQRQLFSKLFQYYRHSEDIDEDTTWSNMSKYIGTYSSLTIKSLHYFARQNYRYQDVFPKLDFEYKIFIKLLIYNKLVSKSKSIMNKSPIPIPIKYIHEFPTLVHKSQKGAYTIDYVRYIINSICCNVCNAGKNTIYLYSKEYDKSQQREVPFYSNIKHSTLQQTGSFLNIKIKFINNCFPDDLDRYKKQKISIIEGAIIPNKLLIPPPSMHTYKPVIKSTQYVESIIDNMMTNNLFKTYRSAVFEPYLYKHDVKIYDDCLNIFNGFAHRDSLDDTSCDTKCHSKVTTELYLNSLIFANFRDKLCNGVNEPSSFEYFDNYIAHMIQKPFERPLVMIVLSGSQGTGKDMFIEFLESLIGMEYVVHIEKMETLLKNFNKCLERKLLTKINEIADKGIHIENHNILKGIITCKTILIEPKGIDSYSISHYSRYIGFSNNEDILKVENTDRRFMMIKTVNDMANDISYHNKIADNMKDISIIRSAFKYYATKDISGYKPTIIPNTSYKGEQKINCLPYTLKFLYYLGEEEKIDPSEGTKSYKNHMENIFCDYIDWCTKMGNNKTVPRLTMIKDFERLGLVKQRIQTDGGRKLGFNITYNELQDLFRIYLKDPTLILPQN